jgi:hypothetical protein
VLPVRSDDRRALMPRAAELVARGGIEPGDPPEGAS